MMLPMIFAAAAAWTPLATPLALPSATALPPQEAGAPAAVPSPKAAPKAELSEGYAARAIGKAAEAGGILEGDDGIVTYEDLNSLLIWRDGKGPNGEAALRQLLELRVIRAIGKAEGVVITDELLDTKMAQLDAEARKEGIPGLESYVQSQGVSMKEFREVLRLGLIHETLTRRALGMADDAPVTGDMQSLWLQQVLKDRGYEQQEHPWNDGVVAVSGDVVITRKEFGDYLRSQVDDADEREACYLILLERAVLKRMPEVTSEGANKALDREIERRAAEAALNPNYKGVTYDRLLEARGLSIEAVRRDPAIRAAALAHEAVDRRHDAESLKKVYEKERAFFDGRFGEAVLVSILFKNATDREDDPLQPSFRKVEQELRDMKAAIPGPEDFKRVVELHSQDATTRERGGVLGQITRAGEAKELQSLREAIFKVVDADPEKATGAIVGPIRVQNGMILALLGERTPAPTWSDMMGHVHRDLRGRFLSESLDRKSVITYLDVKPSAK